jgi:membrane-associated phospholipid phosphatase
MQWLADAISMTYIAGFAVPTALWLQSGGQDQWYIGLILTVIATGAAVEWIKRVVVGGGAGVWSRRPAGARGCDLWCVGGPAGGAPGFPSGHMATVALLVSALWFRLRAPVILWIGVPWIGAMAWSRWAKRCHSVLQIVAGSALGFGVGAWLGYAA